MCLHLRPWPNGSLCVLSYKGVILDAQSRALFGVVGQGQEPLERHVQIIRGDRDAASAPAEKPASLVRDAHINLFLLYQRLLNASECFRTDDGFLRTDIASVKVYKYMRFSHTKWPNNHQN